MHLKEEPLHDILSCKTTAEVFQRLARETQRLGLQNTSWVIKLPLPVNDNPIHTFHTYSQSWQERYWSNNYLAIDPTIRHGFASMQPVIWTNLKQENPEFWEEAKAFGLAEGIAQTTWDRHGCCSMVSLSRGSGEFTRAELLDKLPEITWLAQIAHSNISRLLLSREVPETAGDLSDREREALKLAATGLTSWEIAECMGLTKRTADFHLENARGKLCAENRTDTVVRAIFLDLI